MPKFTMLTFEIPMDSIPSSSDFCKKANFMKRGVFRGEYTYEEIESGAVDGNLILAHANGILIDISWYYDRNSTRWTQLMKSLQRDYSYYFDLVIYEENGTIYDLRDFTEVMLHFDMFDAVYAKIDAYFTAIEKRKLLVKSCILFPNFYKLYLVAGDILLHRRHDYRKSYKFYELISRGSKIMADENYDHILNSAEDENVREYYAASQYQDIYYQIVQFMNSISYRDVGDDIQRFNKIFAVYNELTDYYEVTSENIDQIIDSTDRAFKIFSEFINHYSDYESYRILGLMSLVLYDKFLMSVLFKLAECPTTIRADYKRNVITKMSWLNRSDVRHLAEYASKLGSRVSDKEYERFLGYVKIYNYSRFIEEALKDNGSTEKITYYTSLSNFTFMLPEKCKDDKSDGLGKLTVMHMSYMNDPTEGKIIGELLCGIIIDESEVGRRDVSLPYVFMKCFTSQIDYLPMWNMYGDDAKGVCVVIDWKKSSHMDVPLYNVCYIWHKGNEYEIRESDNPKIKNIKMIKTWVDSMREIVKNTHATKSMIYDLLGNIVFMFKEASYSYEQEKRIIYSYDKVNGAFKHTEEQPPKLFVQPDFTVQVDELILGPKFENVADNMPYMMEELEKMSNGINKEMPKITISDINYR